MSRRNQSPINTLAIDQKNKEVFELSNAELRLAINETHKSILELYNGDHKTALTKHLISLLDVEISRAKHRPKTL